MRVQSSVLSELIEPTLFSLRRPSQGVLSKLVGRAVALTSQCASELGRDRAALHKPSYELGVATAFAELLSTAEQRSEFGDAIEAVNGLEWALMLLHELALIERGGSPIRQQVLAQKLAMDEGNLSRRIGKLTQFNLIERRAAGNSGARFHLTALGRDVMDDLVPGWQASNPSTKQCFADERAATTATSAILERHVSALIDHALKESARFTIVPSARGSLDIALASKIFRSESFAIPGREGRTNEVATKGRDFAIDHAQREVYVAA